MIAQHGVKIVNLWTLHITERLNGQAGHGPFAGESWPAYVVNILAEALPWTPFAIMGAWVSWQAAFHSEKPANRRGTTVPSVSNTRAGSRLFCAWGTVPLILVSLASARRSHYAIYALVPWSIWAALGLSRCGCWLVQHGWPPARVRRLIWGTLTGLAVAYGLTFWVAGSWFNQRGTEWAFYEDIGRSVPSTEPLVLLYDDWDREPYPTPFGPIPHDLAVRLYYLNRPACWHFDPRALSGQGTERCPLNRHHDARSPLVIVGRDRDRPSLEKTSLVNVLAYGPTRRWDRTYLVARVEPRVTLSADHTMQSQLARPIRR